jgi:outer membrane protein assembly factor BamA
MRHQRRKIILPIVGALAGPVLAGAAEDNLPDLAELEARNAVIGTIVLTRENVFDLSDPEENNWAFRLANRLHIVTRDGTIRKQLLLKSGDTVSKQLAEESVRNLRRNKYLRDAQVRPVSVENGVVDLEISTRDVWSLSPELSISHSANETRSRFGIEDSNLLGRGQMLRLVHDKDVDRTENTVEFADNHLGRSWVSTFLRYSDNSDGDSALISVTRPFYALDARWAAGGSILGDDRRSTIYAFGEEAAEYRHARDYMSAFGGWSKGVRNGWVRRFTAGLVYDDNVFSPVPDPTLPAVIPEDRKLAYPFIGLEIVEDGYVTARNRDQMNQTEDFQMGLRVAASVGWSDRSFGADRDALMFSASSSRGYGSLESTALLLSALVNGRLESGNATNTLLTVNARYYRKQSEKRLFFFRLSGTAGQDLDLDNLVVIGGKTGLIGYPLRYQVGESRLVANVEQRYFTDWYPFRIVRVGAAIFANAGRVWGENPLGPDNRGWLVDVGFGMRFSLTRLTDKVVHLDLAFPLNGDDSLDDVQIVLEARKSF